MIICQRIICQSGPIERRMIGGEEETDQNRGCPGYFWRHLSILVEIMFSYACYTCELANVILPRLVCTVRLRNMEKLKNRNELRY